MGRGLSDHQWRILEVLAGQGGCASHRYVAGKAVTPTAPSRIEWKSDDRVMSASQRATLHRSLARLLERGLVVRGGVYFRGFGRFVDPGYILTDAGREALRLRGVDINPAGNFLSANVSPRST